MGINLLPMQYQDKNCTYFLDKFHQNDVRIALTLSGGGTRSVGHYSLIRFLQRNNLDRKIDEVWGTSAGSIAASLFSRDFDIAKGFGELEKIPKIKANFKQAYKLFFSTVNQVADVGIFPTSEFIKIFKHFHNYCALAKRRIPTFVITYGVGSRKKKVMQLDDTEEAFQKIACSCAIPGIIAPPMLEGEHHIDGEITENIPLISICEKWQHDLKFDPQHTPKKLLIVGSNTIGFHRPKVSRWMRHMELKTFANLIEYANDVIGERILQNNLEKIRSIPNVDVILFEPLVWNVQLTEMKKFVKSIDETDMIINNQYEERHYFEMRT